MLSTSGCNISPNYALVAFATSIFATCTILRRDKLVELGESSLINIGYSVLYGYSVFQIKWNKWLSKYKHLFSAYQKEKKLTLFDEGGFKIGQFTESTYDVTDTFALCLKNAEIAILSDITDHGHVNYAFFDNYALMNHPPPQRLHYEESNVSFMGVELEYGGKSYVIHLRDSSHNYYIVGNSLNQYFFKYYIRDVLKISINEMGPYKVTIIDNDVNVIHLNPTQSILLHKNHYEMQCANSTPKDLMPEVDSIACIKL
jgi:hypothetical protein